MCDASICNDISITLCEFTCKFCLPNPPCEFCLPSLPNPSCSTVRCVCTEHTGTTQVVNDSTPDSTDFTGTTLIGPTTLAATSAGDGISVNTEEIKETSLAIQGLFSAVNGVDMNFDVLASSRLLYSVAMLDFISALSINDTVS